jgi:hypothetical protein
MEAICSSETSVDNGLQGVISQKMVLFAFVVPMKIICQYFQREMKGVIYDVL